MNAHENLRIIHCVRSPVGGIFRHIADLARAQNDAGHQVGLICDSMTGGAYENEAIEALRPSLALGVARLPMRRRIGPGDLVAAWRVFTHLRDLEPDIIHAHGAKGGAYARLIGSMMKLAGSPVSRLYCPHGGSLHYDPGSLKGRFFFALEGILSRLTDGLIFVSDYERQAFIDKVGQPPCPAFLVYNGLAASEFEPVQTTPDARDFLYIGMLRDLKGPDLFIEAIAELRTDTGRPATAWMVGDGPNKLAYRSRVKDLGLQHRIGFRDPMPARQAFALADSVVVPSRAESMPYIVLEVLAAGKPLIATRVGGIPEIYGPRAGDLVEPGRIEPLAQAMLATLTDPKSALADAARLQSHLQKGFSIAGMARGVDAAYRACLAGAPQPPNPIATDHHSPQKPPGERRGLVQKTTLKLPAGDIAP